MIRTKLSATTAVVLGLAALYAATIGPMYLNSDAAWYIYVADRWIGGARLYIDVIDTNPPLIVWLTLPPVLIAKLTGISALIAFKCYMFGLAAAALLAVRALVRAQWRGREFVLLSAMAFLCLPFAKDDFGQREHIAVLLTLPYVFAAAAPAATASSRWRWAIGIAAGLGFALKPYFVVPWIGVELVAVLAGGFQSLRRSEFVAAVAAAAVYGITVLALTPQYLGIVNQVRQVYFGLNAPFSTLMRLTEVQVWLAALAVFAAVRWPKGDRLSPMLFAAATGFLLIGLLQAKGWSYHLYPARVYTLLFLASAVLVILDQLPSVISVLRGGRMGLAVVFAGVLMATSGRYLVETRNPTSIDLVPPMIAAMQGIDQGPVAVLGMRTIIWPQFPAIFHAGVSWGLRHNSLWFMSGFYVDQNKTDGGPLEPHTPASMPALEKTFFDQFVDDLCASRPRLIAFEEPLSPTIAGRRSLDLRAYYAQSPRLARLFDAYEARGLVGQFRLWYSVRAPSCDR